MAFQPRVKRAVPEADAPQKSEADGSLADMFRGVSVESPTSSPKRVKKDKSNSEVMIYVNKYSDQGTVFMEMWPAAPVFQWHIVHAARPSIVFKIRERFNKFLEANHMTTDSLANDDHILLRVGGGTPPAGSGQQAYSVAFYTSGDPVLQNQHLLAFIDTFSNYLVEQSDEELTKLTVKLNIASGLQWKPDFTTATQNWEALELSVLAPRTCTCAPPRGGMPIAKLEFVSDKEVFCHFSGETYLYRSGFESQGIVGVYVDADGRPVPRGQPAPDKAPFVRFTTEVVTAYVDDPTAIQRIVAWFSSTIFHGAPVILQVRKVPKGAAYDLFDELFKLPQWTASLPKHHRLE